MALGDNSLGKSLTNVFARAVRKDPPAMRGYLEVDINLLMPSANNPRTQIDQDSLEELAASIRNHGVLQPVVVVKKEGGYEIVAGERRFRAARMAGLSAIPVVIKDNISEKDLDELRLIENIHREDLDPISVAKAYLRLIEVHQLTQEDIAQQVGKDRSSVSNCLRLLTLPEEVQKLAAAGTLSMGHARALAGIKEASRCVSVARQIVDGDLSVRSAEKLINQANSEPATPAAASPEPASPAVHIRELEENLGRLFGAPVKIVEKKGRGRLTVHFQGKTHFRQVIDTLDQAFQNARKLDAKAVDSGA